MSGNKWTPIPNDALPFRKSSFSEGAGSCVEVAMVTVKVETGGAMVAEFDLIAMRDSKDPQGPAQWYTTDEWVAFVQAVRAGEFG
jgi:hypothetical protein